MTLAELEERFAAELEQAEAWWTEVRADELAWIAAGEDVDARFDAKYFEEPALDAESAGRPWLWLAVPLALAAALGMAVYSFRLVRRAQPGAGMEPAG